LGDQIASFFGHYPRLLFSSQNGARTGRVREGYGRYPAKYGCGTRQHGAASRLERSQRNPNDARAIRGKQISNAEAVAAIKERAAPPRTTRVMIDPTSKLPLWIDAASADDSRVMI